ncbi:hypothetical protein [Streptomyces sp. NPDC001743]
MLTRLSSRTTQATGVAADVGLAQVACGHARARRRQRLVALRPDG